MKEIIEKECSRKTEKAKKHYFTKIPPNFLHSLDIHDNNITMMKVEIFSLLSSLCGICMNVAIFFPYKNIFNTWPTFIFLFYISGAKKCKFCEQIQNRLRYEKEGDIQKIFFQSLESKMLMKRGDL